MLSGPFSVLSGLEKLTKYIDHGHRPAKAHESRQPQNHLLGVGCVFLLLPLLCLFFLLLIITSFRRNLALHTHTQQEPSHHRELSDNNVTDLITDFSLT